MKKYLKLEYLLILTLLIGSCYLRLKNLGYSDYIGDEHKAFLEVPTTQTTWEFLLSRRKGPMQFLVSHIPYSITGDFRNEFAQRLPFAIVSILSVLVFYSLVKKVTKNYVVAFISAFLFMVNGFIVGFGRIAQYQNLNLLFSFLALYFYFDLVEKEEELAKSSILGTLFWCLSILSHWDAVFIFPVILIIFVKYIVRKDVVTASKWKLIISNVMFGCLLLLPFLIPYLKYQLDSPENSDYFQRRIEIGHSLSDRYKLLITLYNPFATFSFLIVAGILGVLFLGKSWIFILWFLFSYFFFELFFRKPGTHIYNFLIPAFILSGIGIYNLIDGLSGVLKKVLIFIVSLILGLLFYQTYFIFIDHVREYPWQSKTFYEIKKPPKWLKKYSILETPVYTYEQKLPLFGFPHNRYWDEIDNYINEQNETNNEGYGYITNEVKTISEWYMSAKYKADDGFYVVGVKYPLSFVLDYEFPQINGKEHVYSIKDDGGSTVVKIYRVDK
ncbi:ArnT family glycosyltransferase [Patescibacteria group bacterium]